MAWTMTGSKSNVRVPASLPRQRWTVFSCPAWSAVGCGRLQLIKLGVCPNDLVPAFLANVEMHPVRSDVLLIYSVPDHARPSRRRRTFRIVLNMSHVRGVQFGNLSAQIVHHEADMVDATVIRCLLRPELGR